MSEYDDAEFVRWNEFSQAIYISMAYSVPLTLTSEQATWLWKLIVEKNTKIAELARDNDELIGHLKMIATSLVPDPFNDYPLPGEAIQLKVWRNAFYANRQLAQRALERLEFLRKEASHD